MVSPAMTRVNNVSPAKSTHSTRSASSSGSTRSTRSKKLTPIQSTEAAKKYLDIRKSGLLGMNASSKDVFLIRKHPESKKLHDVASVKTQISQQIKATDESVSNDYYYSQQDMMDYAVNSDFMAMNDKSVEVAKDKIKSTAAVWDPAQAQAMAAMANVPVPGGAAPMVSPALANPYAPPSESVYAQDGLPATTAAAAAVPAANYNPYAPQTVPAVTDEAAMAGAMGAMNMNNMNVPMMASMVPTHAPGQPPPQPQQPQVQGAGVQAIHVGAGPAQQELFPGMLPNVPIVSDPLEIKRNEAIAKDSGLSPLVAEFQMPSQQQQTQFQFANIGNMGMSQMAMNQMQQQMMQQPQQPSNQMGMPQMNGGVNPMQNWGAPSAQQQPYMQQQGNHGPNQGPGPQGPPQGYHNQGPPQHNQGGYNQGYNHHQGGNHGNHGNQGGGYNNRGNYRDRGHQRRGYNNRRRGGGNNRYNDNRGYQRRDRDFHNNQYAQHNNYGNHNNQHNSHSQQGTFQRRQQQKSLFQQKIRAATSAANADKPNPALAHTDPQTLPSWTNAQSISDLFFGTDGGLCDEALYARFFCAHGVSDAVFAFVGFEDIVRFRLMTVSKAFNERIKKTAPVFKKMTLSSWNVILDNGRRFYFGNNGVLNDAALFGFTNPTGLRSVSLSLTPQSMQMIPWDAVTRYLGSVKSLRSLIVKREITNTEQDRMAVSQPTADALGHLVSSLALCSALRLEWAPFTVDRQFVTNLSSMLQDVRLFDEKIQWTEQFLKAIGEHFGSLSVFGFPARCIASISLPTLVSLLEDWVPALVIANGSGAQGRRVQLNPQDLAMLFNRFESIEMDASLITEYPSTDNKTRITELRLRADRHDFWKPLLMSVPHSVTDLSIRNVQFSSNNLVVDVAMPKNTKQIREVTFYDFGTVQIANVINNNVFPNVERLTVAISDVGQNPRAVEADLRGRCRATNIVIVAKTYDPDLE